MKDEWKLVILGLVFFGALFLIGLLPRLFTIYVDDTKNDVEVVEIKKTKEIPENAGTFIYSGGCFWCTESDSEKLDGVYDAVSGFTAGSTPDPKYVYGGWGDHREGSLVYYDKSKLSYRDLVIHTYNTIDYTDPNGQFCDRGHSYSPAIYYKTEEEKKIAEELAPEGSVVPIEPESKFYPVRAGHQDYYKKNQIRYNHYRKGCGRDATVASLPKIGEEKKEKFVRPSNNGKYETIHLTPLQYKVTQRNGTERPFTHAYDKNYEEGIYVDIVGGQALYSSTDKYSSGSGWPSFHKSIGEDGKVLIQTPEFFSTAIELKSTEAESHLGHIIFDNPHREDRRRHCINGAALKFIPKAEMEEKGYGEWLYLFK